MGLFIYIKKQTTLLSLYINYLYKITKNFEVSTISNLLIFLNQTTSTMKSFLMIKVLMSRIIGFLNFLKVLKNLQLLVPPIFWMLTFLFKFYQYTIGEWSFYLPISSGWLFCLLVIRHFVSFYEFLLALRLIVEWFPAINPYNNSITEFLCFVTDPYFKVFDNIIPAGRASIFAYICIDYIVSFIDGFVIFNFTRNWHDTFYYTYLLSFTDKKETQLFLHNL